MGSRQHNETLPVTSQFPIHEIMAQVLVNEQGKHTFLSEAVFFRDFSLALGTLEQSVSLVQIQLRACFIFHA